MELKLSLEEKEALSELTSSQGWLPLLKTIEFLASEQDARVLSYNLSKGLQGLAEEKARAEGARQLQRAIVSLKAKFVP